MSQNTVGKHYLVPKIEVWKLIFFGLVRILRGFKRAVSFKGITERHFINLLVKLLAETKFEDIRIKIRVCYIWYTCRVSNTWHSMHAHSKLSRTLLICAIRWISDSVTLRSLINVQCSVRLLISWKKSSLYALIKEL